MTDAKITVELEIESIKEIPHSIEITPSTPQNDWWGETKDWTTLEVKFTNGFKKEFSTLAEIDFCE